MIIEPSNYTYETMPDYTDAVDGAVEIPVTGEEMEIRSAPGRASHLFRDPPG